MPLCHTSLVVLKVVSSVRVNGSDDGTELGNSHGCVVRQDPSTRAGACLTSFATSVE